MNPLYIINPAALGGRGGNAWTEFQSLWPSTIDPQDVRLTTGPGSAREVAASAHGRDLLVVAGGDGTVGEVLSGIMDRDEPRPGLAMVPAGTGNDAAHAVGIRSVEDAVAALQAGNARPFDLIRVDCLVDGRPVHRYAFLLSDVGYDAFCFRFLKPWMKRLFSPRGAYFLALALGVLFYRSPRMTVRWADQSWTGRAWMVVIGNAEWAGGGGMRIAPGAKMDDGELDVTILPARPRMEAPRMIAQCASGRHLNEPGVQYFAAKRIEVESDPPAGLTMDGDIFGTTPATFTVCPRAVRIVSRT